MNEDISSVLITKGMDNEYETRFLSGSSCENTFSESKLRPNASKGGNSIIVDRMGGESRLEILVVYMSQQILDDLCFRPIFGDFLTEELVSLLRDLMWYALDDSFHARVQSKMHHKSKVLKTLCRLGVMDEPAFMDRISMHLLDSMRVCSFRDTRAVTEIGDRFVSVRTALEEVAETRALNRTVHPVTFFSLLCKPFSQCTRNSNDAVIR